MSHPLLENIRAAAWRAKQQLKAALPPPLKYVEHGSVQFVKDAWPALKTVLPGPLVRWPSEVEAEWIAATRSWPQGPVVLPPVVLNVIPNGILFPDSGAIATAEGVLIDESCKDRRVREGSQTYNRLRWPKPRSLGDRLVTTVEIGKYQTSHGHWILEGLPRLFALSQVDGPVCLVVRDTLKGAKRTLLEWALPPNVTVLEVDPEVPLTASRVLLAPYPGLGGFGLMRPEIIDHLQRTVVAAARREAPARRWPERIYVSREKTKWSRVRNEVALKHALFQLGFENVVLEDLPVAEQVLHFVHARVVVGALSSGLTNCLFQKQGALVEIFAGGLGPDSHTPSLNEAGLAMSNGLQYVPVYHPHRSPEPDFEVDVPRVVAAVRGLSV